MLSAFKVNANISVATPCGDDKEDENRTHNESAFRIIKCFALLHSTSVIYVPAVRV